MSSNIDWALATLDDRKELYLAMERFERWGTYSNQNIVQANRLREFYREMRALEAEYVEVLVGRIMLKRKDFES